MKLRPHLVVFIAIAIGVLLVANPAARSSAYQLLAGGLRAFSRLALIHLH